MTACKILFLGMSVMLFPEDRSLSWGIEEEGRPHMCGWASPHPTAQQEKKDGGREQLFML